MAYPYFTYPSSYPGAYQAPSTNAYQQPGAYQNSAQALQTQLVYCVPSYDVVKSTVVEPGKSETFFDNNLPFYYVKTAGVSLTDPPKTRFFKCTECTEEQYLQAVKNGDISDASQNSIDLSLYAKTADIDKMRAVIDAMREDIDKLRFDIDAVGEKSSKKMVQRARKDADEE